MVSLVNSPHKDLRISEAGRYHLIQDPSRGAIMVDLTSVSGFILEEALALVPQIKEIAPVHPYHQLISLEECDPFYVRVYRDTGATRIERTQVTPETPNAVQDRRSKRWYGETDIPDNIVDFNGHICPCLL